MARVGPKVVELAELPALLRPRRDAGATVALCHGCFDLVHIGHVDHLQVASTLADLVVVSVSSDPVCAKAPGRPAFGLRDRMDFLAALALVDFVVPSLAETAVPVIEAVRPDVFVKGADYAWMDTGDHEGLAAERAAVEAAGGRLELTVASAQHHSSTALLSRYGKLHEGDG